MASKKLKVLMLGWEFPPQISGGLGTACEGLTQALSKHDLQIHFFMPRLYGNETAPYLNLYDVARGENQNGVRPTFKREYTTTATHSSVRHDTKEIREEVLLYGIPSFLSPYLRPQQHPSSVLRSQLLSTHSIDTWTTQELITSSGDWGSNIKAEESPSIAPHYGSRLFDEVENYRRRAVLLANNIDFDVIHAHDWMTYPAALTIAHESGKPVVLHVHSLESDRSGLHKNEFIAEIERASLQRATSIITVSRYTKQKVIEDYGVPSERISVVHNGLMERSRIKRPVKMDGRFRVLFLGRVTFQKGPDYFVKAALKVLKILPNTQFILAGSGDMLEPLRRLIIKAKATDNFILPGFLKGHEVDEVFATSDLYVMPSVSEPFGISALEALYYDIPIIVSRQSGVSEVIQHALKADFWDIDEFADLIIGALKFPELRSDLMQMARVEVKQLDWDSAAKRVLNVYQEILEGRL